ncbi:MAG: hypothetical protein MSJ26_00415 [Oscillospiraceae bacterium]|nr:hypothetical protein [Oscillospiraceae bacterium]
MTKHSFVSSYKYQLRRIILLPILTVIAIIVFMLLFTGFINYSFDGVFSLAKGGAVWLDALAGLMLLLFGGCFCHEFLNTGAANGVSRTTTVIASAASFFTSSAACSAFISVVSPLLSLLCKESADYWFLEIMYGTRKFFQFYGENPFVVRIRFFVMCTFMLFFCSMFGFAVMAIFYKLSKRCSTIVFTAIAIFLVFGYPVSNAFLSQRGIDLDEKLEALFEAWCRLFGMAHVNGSQAGNCVQGALIMVIFSAVFVFIA